PYVCIVVFIIGHIFRYRYDQFGWTAKSSEFFEKKQLMIGSMLFHLGIIPVFLGHVSGLGIPKAWTRALGISDEMYHFGAVWGGGFLGIVTLAGMFILTSRRFSNSTVRQLSSKSDMIVNMLLLVSVIIGVYSSLVTNNVVAGFDYRDSLSFLFRSLFTLNPNTSLIISMTLAIKFHIFM